MCGIIALPLALVPFFLGALDNRPAPVSFIASCRGDYTVWLLAACAAASLSSFASAYGLARSAWKRHRGHALNVISIRYAVRDVVQGVAFGAAFFGIGSAPCWVIPTLYLLVAVVTAVTAVTAIGQEALLVRAPHWSVDSQIARIDARIVRLSEWAIVTTEDESREAVGLLTEVRATLLRMEAMSTASNTGGAQK